MRDLQMQLAGLAIGGLILEAIAYGVGLWLLYVVIKTAIRDGIRESGLVQTWRTTVSATHRTKPADLPDMRAER